MIKLKNILLEKNDASVDIDRLLWNDQYLDAVAIKFGYNDNFSSLFWHEHYCPILYHCTIPEKYERIKIEGLCPKKENRGAISNRNIGPAIFTCIEEEVPLFKSYYGPVVIEINTKQMKMDGFTPYVEMEPDWERAKKLEFVFHKLGKEDAEASRFVDSSDQNTEGTVIFYECIPTKYLRIAEDF